MKNLFDENDKSEICRNVKMKMRWWHWISWIKSSILLIEKREEKINLKKRF